MADEEVLETAASPPETAEETENKTEEVAADADQEETDEESE